MIACNYLYLVVVGFAVLGWGSLAYAEGDVTVVSAPGGATTAPAPKTLAADGTPVVHKSSHKKKPKSTTTATSTSPATGATTASSTATPTATTASPTATASSSATASGTATTSAPKPVKASGDATASTPKTANTTSGNTTVPKTASANSGNTVAPKTAKAAASTATHVKPAAPSPATAETATPAPARSWSSSTARAMPSSMAIPPAAAGPTVETGALPIAKHSSVDAALNSAPIPTSVTMQTPGTPYHPTLAGIFPPISPLNAISPSRALSSYSEASRTSSPSNDFVFTNFNKRGKNVYPWKTNIFTTKFWIGEGGSGISSTTNYASSWDEEWVSTNHGSDSPDDRNGYASGDHASTVNPFYIALPFNDLAFPDKAREYLPPGWHRPPKDGKQVSACQHRWVEIKNAQGRICYAQWEDVGPLRYDHAEYVFGNERPTSAYTHAGLDVSPAVADYLAINESGYTSWRFVDDEDVPPGQWLKYDEQAVIYTALHQLKNSTPSAIAPIQTTSEPTGDSDDSNKKRVGAAKG